MSGKKINKKKCEFEISSPKWMKTFFIIFSFIGVLPIIIIGVLEVLEIITGVLLPVACLCGMIAVIGLLGLYVYHTEKFSYIDGVYYYNKPFKKNQKTQYNLIDHVELRLPVNIRLMDVVFLDKNDNKLINFYDDGTAFRKNLFLKSLEYNRIPYYLVDNKKMFKHKELIEVIDKLLKYFKVNREFISLDIYNNEKPFVISIKSDLYIMLDVKNEGYAISINDYHNDDFSLDEEIIVNNMDEIFDVFIKTYSKYIYK